MEDKKYFCKDCGMELDAGEGSVFTCCEVCWDKHYKNQSPESDCVTKPYITNSVTYIPKQSILTLVNEMGDTSEMGVTGHTQYWTGYKQALTELKGKIEAL